MYFVWSGVVWGTYAWSVTGFQSRCFMRIFDVHFKTAWWRKKKKIKEILKYQENDAWGKRKVAVLIKGKCKTRAIETNKSKEKPDDLNVSPTFTLHCAAERQMIWQQRLMKIRYAWLCTGPRNRTFFNSLKEVPQFFLVNFQSFTWSWKDKKSFGSQSAVHLDMCQQSTVSPHEDFCFLQCRNQYYNGKNAMWLIKSVERLTGRK